MLQPRASKVTLGVIGCGHWGPNFIRTFSSLEGATVKYACDLSLQKRGHVKTLFPWIETLSSHSLMLKDKAVTAVVIATPAITHYALARECLRAGKHVLVEKPITTDVAEAKELIRMAGARRQVLMVGHTFKYNAGVRKLRTLVQSNLLGTIYYIHSRRTNLGPLRRDVNAMWDLAPHDVSIVSYLLGTEPLAVAAQGRKFLAHGLEDVVFITLTYPKNVFVHIHVSWLDPRKVREITVVGKRKMALFNDLNPDAPITIYDKSVVEKRFSREYRSFEEFQMIVKDGVTRTPRVSHREPLKAECRHFIDCVRDGITPLTDGADGLAVLRVMTALDASLKAGGASIALRR